MKSKVYRRKVDILDEMLDHIMSVIARINVCEDALRRATCYVVARIAKCMDVDGAIFENALYWVNRTKFVT
jgi:predicted peroxiredoxin